QTPVGTYQCLGSWLLKEGSGRHIDRRPEKVVGRGVADVELDARVKGGQLNQFGGVQLSAGRGRLGCQGRAAQLLNRPLRTNLKRAAVLAVNRPALEYDPSRLDPARLSLRVTGKAQLLIVVQTEVGEPEYVLRLLHERIKIKPLDQGVQPAFLLQ